MSDTKAGKQSKRTLADFRAVHDKSFVIPTKIRDGIAKIGAEGWEYEPDFIKICGVSPNDFAHYREEFAEFYVAVGGSRNGKRVWAGSKALATKMREMA